MPVLTQRTAARATVCFSLSSWSLFFWRVGRVIGQGEFTTVYRSAEALRHPRAAALPRDTSNGLPKRPSLGDQQIFGEGPLVVYPLGVTAEAGSSGDLWHLFAKILVTTFRPNGFALKKGD